MIEMQGRIQDFKLGGRTLKNCTERREARKFLGVFRVKNHDFTPKNHIFSNFRGGGGGCGAPLDPPLKWLETYKDTCKHTYTKTTTKNRKTYLYVYVYLNVKPCTFLHEWLFVLVPVLVLVMAIAEIMWRQTTINQSMKNSFHQYIQTAYNGETWNASVKTSFDPSRTTDI